MLDHVKVMDQVEYKGNCSTVLEDFEKIRKREKSIRCTVLQMNLRVVILSEEILVSKSEDPRRALELQKKKRFGGALKTHQLHSTIDDELSNYAYLKTTLNRFQQNYSCLKIKICNFDASLLLR